MKSKIIKILLFLFIGLECLALTNRERIEKDLRKLNINDSKIIAQTITIDEKIGDKLLQGEGVEVLLKDLKNLVAENPKNFYISYQIARYYLETEKNIEEVKKNKKYFDLYIENVPQEDEKLSMKMLYYEKVGDKVNFKKYYDEFFKKTSGKGLGVLARTKYKKDAASIKKDFALALDLFKKEIEDGNKDEVTDEEFFIVQIAYEQIMLQEILEKNQYQKGIDYYLDNIANKDYYTQSVLNMYGRKLAFQLHLIIQINEKHLNKNKENIKKIRDSKVYKELEKMGEIINKI
mgnify:CR=1 FL=1